MGARFGSERLTTRLEAGLAGLARSSADLQLEDAPFLRWVHVEGDEPPSWSRALPPPLAAVAGAGGRVRGHPRRRPGHHQHLGRHGGPEIRGAHARVAWSVMPRFWRSAGG